jgi:hypothetical protein
MFGPGPDEDLETSEVRRSCGVRRIQQGRPAASANLDGMIAGNFEGVDLTVPIIAVAVTAASFIGGFGQALRSIGRSGTPRAVTRWQRTPNSGLRHSGQVTMAAAAVILIGGTWIGLEPKSFDQINTRRPRHAAPTPTTCASSTGRRPRRPPTCGGTTAHRCNTGHRARP